MSSTLRFSKRVRHGVQAGLALAVAVAASSGCGARTHRITVAPDVEGSVVFLDELEVGRGETELSLARQDSRPRALRVCGPEGWRCTELTVDTTTPRQLAVSVPRDNAWHATVAAAEEVGVWHELPPLTLAQAEAAYRSLRDVVRAATDGSELEVDDPRALYLRTAWQLAGEPSDPLRIRSRIELALSESTRAQRLVFKLRIVSETIDRQGLALDASSRTFPSFLAVREAAIAELATLSDTPEPNEHATGHAP